MAVDKLVDSTQLDSDLTSVANAIRTKGGTSAQLAFPSGFVSAIGNISTGGGNLVTGTFTGATSGSAVDISVSYTGSGYPVAGIIYPSAGANTGDIASLAQQYAIMIFAFAKTDMSSTPTFSGDTEENKSTIVSLYKYSNSDPTYTTTSKANAQQFYMNSNASATTTSVMRMKSSTTMSVYIASTSYGFKEGIEFTYQLIYSS